MKFVKQFIIVLLATLFITPSIQAAPRSQLWPRWQANNPTSKQTISYQGWQYFLNKYVSSNTAEINLVNYRDVTTADKNKLKQFIHRLEQIHIDHYNRQQQLAYWINLYNAETVYLVLKYFPIKSILQIKLSSGFSRGPWDAKVLKVEGIAISLNDIEHRILRPIWHDSRIHFALNCASIGCPNLQKNVFTADNTNGMLTEAAQEYINGMRGLYIKDKKLYVSKIFIWYRDDFGTTDQNIILYLQKYASPELKARLQRINTISGSYYDWGLNGLYQ